MDTLVTTAWLSKHLDDPDLVVLDCSVCTEFKEDGGFRNSSGRSDYHRGHIPLAGFADLTSDLSDTDSPIEFAVPTPERFCAAMGDLGVGDGSRVVLYDSGIGWAARVWWMLRWVGFDRAAVLDGGFGAWTSQGLPLSTESVARPAKRLTPAPRPALIADHDEVLAAIDDDAVSLIDTLPEDHYCGGRPSTIGLATYLPRRTSPSSRCSTNRASTGRRTNCRLCSTATAPRARSPIAAEG